MMLVARDGSVPVSTWSGSTKLLLRVRRSIRRLALVTPQIAVRHVTSAALAATERSAPRSGAAPAGEFSSARPVRTAAEAAMSRGRRFIGDPPFGGRPVHPTEQ